jgi:hypothetical protein
VPLVAWQASSRQGGIALVALAAIVVTGACSAFSADPLAIVPPRETTDDVRAVREPRGTPRAGRVSRRDPGTTRSSVSVLPEGGAILEPSVPPASPGASVVPEPPVEVIRLRPRPAPGPFSMNLYRPGDFSHQATKDWCVAGSTQTMMNIMSRGRNDRSTASQARLYRDGRRFSPDKRKLGPIGVDLLGWAALLDRGGYGPYVVDGAGTRRAAIRKAARALRITGRPVGLVTWRGAHSWVMSGFSATADPAWQDDYEVTAVHIQDAWYPWVSTIWGASRPPDSLVPVAALAEDYLPYQRPRAHYPGRDGRFMLILPALPPGTVAR